MFMVVFEWIFSFSSSFQMVETKTSPMEMLVKEMKASLHLSNSHTLATLISFIQSWAKKFNGIRALDGSF